MVKSRNIKRVDTPNMLPDGSALHRNRLLVAPGQWDETDPFLVLMEDWYSQGSFDKHPHRGIETVTYVIDGASSHFDNRGKKGVIGSGEALWMTAGRGIVHNEIPVDDRPIHTLQLWVNLPRADKLVDADIQELKGDRVAKRSLPGAEVIVFSGSSGNIVTPTRNHAKVTMVEVRLAPNATFEQELPAGYNGFAVVLEGVGFMGATTTPVRSGQVAWLAHENDESSVKFETKDQNLRVILFAGKPLREPVVARGPFVMNTEEEIEQAYAEFRRDRERFGVS
jgi:redox-sensitive bicupin YhaK (pirin superfamily)